jgi:hypothetical protein
VSSFTEARWERVYLPDGRPKTRGGRPVFAIRGAGRDGFRYEIGFVGSGLSVHVPEGFETDVVSDPTGVLALVGATRRMIKSSAVHDCLREDLRFTKLQSDAVFLMAMETEGTDPLWREVAFNAVRLNQSRTQHQEGPAVDWPPY